VWQCGAALRSQAVSDIIRTTLGPRSMLKMLLDASGGAWLRRAALCAPGRERVAWRLARVASLTRAATPLPPPAAQASC
jgi:hypothetical protein